MEYLNILPDLSRFHDVNEASFLKSLANQSIHEDGTRIRELQEQVELYKQ